VIIVGGASAGLAAAIYTSRQGLKTLLLTKDIGGQAILTSHIENYPGFESISGLELMEKFQRQAANFGTEIRYEEVKRISRSDSSNRRTSFNDSDINMSWFTTSTEEEYECLSVILAFGKTPKDLAVPGTNNERCCSSRDSRPCTSCITLLLLTCMCLYIDACIVDVFCYGFVSKCDMFTSHSYPWMQSHQMMIHKKEFT
jgi:thioredoxin reductase (NADPH)